MKNKEMCSYLELLYHFLSPQLQRVQASLRLEREQRQLHLWQININK